MKTSEALDQLRNLISKGGAGVTLQEDPSGNWGQAGTTYVSVRWYDSANLRGPLVQVTMIVQKVVGVDEEIIEDEEGTHK